MKGAKKWADLTKQNIGKTIAFIIDNQIYTMPVINGEIKHGVALITGLKNETFAKNISESLNSSISSKPFRLVAFGLYLATIDY